MAKGGRGGKRGGGGGGNLPYTDMPAGKNQLPAATLSEALGRQGAPRSMAEAFTTSNPYFSDQYADYSCNCQRCVMAYEMQRRGYDVEALPTYRGDDMPVNGKWMSVFNGAVAQNVGGTTERAQLKRIEKTMAGWGDGARAILRIGWAGGGGHVINLEQSAGKLYVYDAQCRTRSTGTKYLKEHMQYFTLSRTQIVRTDNLTINDDMRLMVKNNRS